jgi:IclR family pca regulon transcriptional regulator
MILELFSDRRPALTMSEIAELTGLNRATSYRFCQTLLALGYLEEADERRLRPGMKAVSLARAALSSHELPDLALPHLRGLHDATGETVNMALLDGADVVYVSRLLSDDLLALRLFVGSRLLAELRRIRRRGYALNNQELVIGICGVAAAVFGVSGRPVAAINISLTRVPEREEIESKLGPAVMETARAVSELATQLAVDVAAPSRLLRQGAR